MLFARDASRPPGRDAAFLLVQTDGLNVVSSVQVPTYSPNVANSGESLCTVNAAGAADKDRWCVCSFFVAAPRVADKRPKR